MAIIGERERLTDPRLMRLAQDDTKPWYRKPQLRRLYLLLVPAALGVEWTSGFDSSMLNSLQAVPSWANYFGNPDAARLGLLGAIYALGGLMAIPFVPPLSRVLGRRRSIMAASLVMVLGASLQAGATSTDMFLAARWVLGFGIPFAIVNAAALLGELSYARERAVMTSLFNASWFVGAIVAAGATYGTFQWDASGDNTWSWRLPSLLQLVPSVCQLASLPFCPESPRWLVAQDRSEEALAVLQRYHSEGDDGDAFVRLELAEIQSVLEHERLAQAASNTNRGIFAWSAWGDMFRDAPMRRRFLLAVTVGVFSQWSGNGLLSFYMKKILNLVGLRDDRTVQQVILANTCWGFLTAVPAAVYAPRFPRRTMFLVCTIGTCVVYTVWTIASARFAMDNSSASAIPVLLFIFVYSPFYNIGWNALAYTYMVEIFPFQQRAQGIAVEQLAVRCAGFFNTYVNPIALDAITWRYYIVYCVWILFEVFVVYAIFPETSNRTLEELSFMFEGQAVQDQVKSGVDKALNQQAELELEEVQQQQHPTSISPTLIAQPPTGASLTTAPATGQRSA